MFTQNYLDLLILQYSDSIKASDTITALTSKFEALYNIVSVFDDSFDVDSAVGVQLDTVGKIVGVSRIVPFSVAKKHFGFADNALSYPMDDKFLSVVSYPMDDRFSPDYSESELDDFNFRFFIKSKIIKNIVSAYMIRDSENSLQNAIDFLFSSKAYLVDNGDMSLTLYVNSDFDFDLIPFINQLEVIPRPQGVSLSTIISYNDNNTFGFADNVNNNGFGDKFGTAIDSYFAEKII